MASTFRIVVLLCSILWLLSYFCKSFVNIFQPSGCYLVDGGLGLSAVVHLSDSQGFQLRVVLAGVQCPYCCPLGFVAVHRVARGVIGIIGSVECQWLDLDEAACWLKLLNSVALVCPFLRLQGDGH